MTWCWRWVTFALALACGALGQAIAQSALPLALDPRLCFVAFAVGALLLYAAADRSAL